jgi:hypothetical protein
VTTSASTCTASTWQGSANTGSNFGGGVPFTDIVSNTTTARAQTIDGCTGVLGCDGGTTSGNNVVGPLGNMVFTDSAFAGTAGDWGLVRGPNTQGTCQAVPFQFFVDLDNNISTYTALKGSQALAVEYVIQWAPVAIASSGTDIDGNPAKGWTDGRPKVAWGFATQPPANLFVPALACLADPVDPGDITPAVMPTIPAVEPFVSLYANGYTQYQPNTPAGMCIVQHGWTSKNGMVQYWDKVIDLSDSWIIVH